MSRAGAVSCVLINLCATPGLGSVMARRYWAGTGQLVLAVTGFCLIVEWMVGLFHGVILEQLDEPVPPHAANWLGKWGVICFGAAWLWSLFTSISIWRHSQADEPSGLRPVPPRLADSTGTPPKSS